MEEKVKKPIYKKAWFWIIIVLFVLIIAFFSTGDNNDSKNDIAQNSEEIQEISEDEYKSQCQSIDYKELARNPNQYKGNKYKFTGEVIQVQEDRNGQVVLRVNVTKGEYGFWDDTIWVEYKYKDENESKILEDDIIDIYGEFNGLKTYTSVLGSSVSIPQIMAKYTNLNTSN